VSQQLQPREGVVGLAILAALAVVLSACGSDETSAAEPTAPASTQAASSDLDRVVKIDGERGLYVR
jgi:hypothetical protein